MRYNPLGRSGLYVSELCLGTMTFGGGDGIWQAIGQVQQDEADMILKASIDAGINFIDTANVYSEGVSETILGQGLKNLGIKRDQVVIATKVLGRMSPGPNGAGASRGHIMDQVEQSLKRLQTDHIDLYQIHGVDPLTPIEETVTALDNLVQRGLVRYVGLSNWAAWQVAKATGIAEAKGVSVAQVALAWLLHQPAVSTVIIGAKRIDQLADNLGAMDLILTAEERATLDEVSKLPAEYPRWMIDRQSGYRLAPQPPR